MAKSTKSNQKSPEQLTQENRYLRSHRIGDEGTKIALALIKWGGIVAVSRYFYGCIAALAGKQTSAVLNATLHGNVEATVNFTSDFRTWVTIGGISIAIGGVLYGRSRERLYRATIQRLHPYKELYEKQLDPQRTSSALSADGLTRPEDV